MLHEQPAGGACDHWRHTALARLTLIIVLDQFSRHTHRGDARAFAQDAKARELTLDGITQGWDERLAFAQAHADEITRFGRFPHRNQVLSRRSTEDELAFLQSGEAAA